jgi:putative Mg2+ transporter-C (MgtC) family protein
MTNVFFDADMSLIFATINMAFALVLGAVIGSERQFRGRMAGLRTNALVSLGAAGFVTFAALYPDDINPTRVAAQVVSGIGFLGAGIIFRDGFNIQGINTAATLWCSAAVGLISGSGHVTYAIALTLLVFFSNLGLRPIVRKLKSATDRASEVEHFFELTLECKQADEKDIRAVLVGCLRDQGLEISQIESSTDNKIVEIIAQVRGLEANSPKVERTVSQIALYPGLSRISWHIAEDEGLNSQ